MSEFNDGIRGRRGPTVDVVGHVRSVIRYLPVGIVVGIVAAIVAFTYQSSTATRYESTVVAQIVVPGATPTGTSGPTSTDSATAAGPFVALVDDQGVLADIAKSAKVNIDPATLVGQITVTASPVPGIVTVTADGDSTAQASAIANAVVSTLDSTYLKRQQAATTTPASSSSAAGMADVSAKLTQLSSQLDGVINEGGTAEGLLRDLTTQVQRLSAQTTSAQPAASPTAQRLIVLSQPQGGVKASTIPPIAIASVIGLIVMILVTELLAALRSFRGTTITTAWVRRVARQSETPVDTAGRGTAISSAPLAAAARAGGRVLVLSTDGTDAAVAQIVATASQGVDTYAISDAGWNQTDGGHRLAVIVVREGERNRSDVVRALESLQAWEIPARIVVLPHSRDTFSLPGGLAIAFRKPEAAAQSSAAPSQPVAAAQASSDGSADSTTTNGVVAVTK